MIRSVIIRVITKSDDTKSYYQLIIKITISEKRRIAKLWKIGKINIKMPTKELKGYANILRPPHLPKTQKQACARTHVITALNVIG